MKRSGGGPPRTAVGLLALALLAGCGDARPTTGTPVSGTHPILVIASFFPLTVEGRRFRPGVKVVLRAQAHQARLNPVYARAVVRRDGTFTVRLHGYGLDPCTGVTVTAISTGHQRASTSSRPRGCPPVPMPPGGGRRVTPAASPVPAEAVDTDGHISRDWFRQNVWRPGTGQTA